GIVKLDDAGVLLSARRGESGFQRLQRGLGAAILAAAPWLMKGLSVLGTAAMFLVGGGIVVHSIPPLHHLVEGWAHALGDLATLAAVLLQGVAGVLLGTLVLLLVAGIARIRGR